MVKIEYQPWGDSYLPDQKFLYFILKCPTSSRKNPTLALMQPVLPIIKMYKYIRLTFFVLLRDRSLSDYSEPYGKAVVPNER
jgi:hypothetical protein